MIGFGENLGSGFPLILSAWNEKHWLKPELVEQRELLQVKLVLYIETKKDINHVKEDTYNFSNDPKDDPKDDPKEVSERQAIILRLIKDNYLITIQEMTQKMNVSEKTIKRELSALQEKGILIRKGGRKNGEWEILN